METKDFSKVNDGNHLPSLCQTLWNFKNLRVYTDLVIHCSDGIVEIHKAMMMAVFKTSGVGMCQLLDSDTIIVPGITVRELEDALYNLYCRFDGKPLLELLSCFAPLNPGVSVTGKPIQIKKKGGINISDILECNLNIKKEPIKIKPAPVKIEPKIEGYMAPQKKAIARLPPREPAKPYGRKKFRTSCPHCQLIISGKKAYRRHLRNSHQVTMPREGEEVQCQVCGKTLKHMQILKTHMKEVHGDRSYTCNLCGLTLSCQRNLNTHMISHTTPSIPCDQCGKLFKRKYAVKNHIKKFHMQIKEKMCDQCDKSFADARHLREHVLAIHDKLKPFGCEVCDFKCARIDNLNTHRKKSHGLGNKLTRAEHDDWVLQGKHPFVKNLIGGADASTHKGHYTPMDPRVEDMSMQARQNNPTIQEHTTAHQQQQQQQQQQQHHQTHAQQQHTVTQHKQYTHSIQDMTTHARHVTSNPRIEDLTMRHMMRH